MSPRVPPETYLPSLLTFFFKVTYIQLIIVLYHISLTFTPQQYTFPHNLYEYNQAQSNLKIIKHIAVVHSLFWSRLA